MKRKRWDVFISHASEDKESIVEPIVEALSALGAKVWYDEFTVGIGDSLTRSIDKGLAQSSFGLVILSPSFFSKNWPQYELRGLTAMEVDEEQVILPIWHGVTRADVLRHSPPLADKLALRTDQDSPTQIALKVLEVIRPDLLTKLHRKLVFLQIVRSGKVLKIDPRTLAAGPIRHKELPGELIGRIRLIRAALLGARTGSMEYWIDGFRRDAYPSREIAWWEHVAACYTEYVKMTRLNPEQRKHAFVVTFGLCLGVGKDLLERHIASIPPNDLAGIERIVKHRLPPYDFEESFPEEIEAIPQELLDLFAESAIEEPPSE